MVTLDMIIDDKHVIPLHIDPGRASEDEIANVLLSLADLVRCYGVECRFEISKNQTSKPKKIGWLGGKTSGTLDSTESLQRLCETIQTYAQSRTHP